MRTWLRRIGLGLVILLLLAGAGALWKRDEIARLLAVNTLFAPDRIVANFSDMGSAFLTVPVPRGDRPVSPLPVGPEVPLPEGVAGWIQERSVTGLVVLKDGRITHQSYHLGTDPGDLRISWSIAKSALSLLYGILEAEGALPARDTRVTEIVPQLAGTAYDGARVIDVLQMESGVLFDEDYLDRNSDINRMGRVLALGGTMDGFAASITDSFAAPGAVMQYTSIDTHVIGMVIRAATGRTIPDLMSEKLFGPMGLEAAPTYLTDGEGVAFVLGGLNMTTRDYARIGELARREGRLNGQQIVPAAWVRESTAPSALTGAGRTQYGFQWWMPADARPGEFFARGIYGQYVYVDRARGVTIAVNAADRSFADRGVHSANIETLRAIAAAQ